MDNRLQFSTGYTPNLQKRCVRCGKLHDEQLYWLCASCRLQDWIISKKTEAERRDDELILADAKAILEEREHLLSDDPDEEYLREARSEYTEWEAQEHDYRDWNYTREINRP
jgi:hypothetical protein